MHDRRRSYSFGEVAREELTEIVERRRAAGFRTHSDNDVAAKQDVRRRVGLALSGGGIRSASFNLGLLQSLYRAGLLRHVDYLSTVSGGGYLGGYLTSLITNRPDGAQIDWLADGDEVRKPGKQAVAAKPSDAINDTRSTKSRKLEFYNPPQSPQPVAVRRLITGGLYLRKPWLFFNHYFFGVLAINAFALSLTLTLATALALAFRILDYPQAQRFLNALGFGGDIPRAFFPAIVFGSLWILAWGGSYLLGAMRNRAAAGRVARVFFVCMVISTALGGAVVLGTGDISIADFKTAWGFSDDSDLVVQTARDDLTMLFLVALGIALLPYIRVKDLIRSGMRPRKAVEGWIFAIASRALLYGLPLLLFGLIARENISGYAPFALAREQVDQAGERRFPLVWHHLHSGGKFWDAIAIAAQSSNAKEIRERLDKSDAATLGSRAASAEAVSPDIASLREAARTLRLSQRESTDKAAPPAGSAGNEIQRADNGLARTTGDDGESGLMGKDTPQARAALLIWRSVDGVGATAQQDHPLVKVQSLADETAHDTRNLVKASRIGSCAAWAFWNALGKLFQRKQLGALGDETSFARRWKLNEESDAHRGRVFDSINRMLAEPAFYELVTEETMELPAVSGDGKDQRNERNRLGREVVEYNVALLQELFPGHFRDQDAVFAYVVAPTDQQYRWTLLKIFAVATLATGLLVSLNQTSAHGYYRDRLADLWIAPQERNRGLKTVALKDIDNTAKGGPYHLLNATMNNIMSWRDRRIGADEPTSLFILSKRFCGADGGVLAGPDPASPRLERQTDQPTVGFARTEDYAGGHYDLANAIAVSGAAVSPLVLRNPLLVVLLLLSNSRTGQWLSNPVRGGAGPARFGAALGQIGAWLWPSPLLMLMNYFCLRAADQSHCFVTDGGQHENLGVESLLRRRCRIIIAADVSQDEEHQFVDLLRLVRRVRLRDGILLERCDLDEPRKPTRALPDADEGLGLNELTPDPETGLSLRQWLVAKIIYPPADWQQHGEEVDEGWLIYIKPGLTGSEPDDLAQYRRENPAFPHDPTLDQFYDPRRFESYRMLGEIIGKRLSAQLCAARAADATAAWLADWGPGLPRASRKAAPRSPEPPAEQGEPVGAV